MNLVRTILRSALRNKSFTALRLISLSVGLAACVLVALYIRHELSYDNFHINGDETYRIVEQMKRSDGFNRIRANTGVPLGPMIGDNIPSVKKTVRYGVMSGVIAHDGRVFREDKLAFVDPDFLELFSFPLIRGDSVTALAEPFQVVMSQETAEKYFGKQSPVGKTLLWNNKHRLTVTGVLADIPSNSHLRFEMLVSFASLSRTIHDWDEHWDAGTATYVQLDPGANTVTVAGQIGKLAAVRQAGKDVKLKYFLEPLKDIHLQWESSPERVFVMFTVALLILLVAVINYINLSIALILRRATSLVIRRILGATRLHLTGYYIAEALLFLVFSAVVAIALAELILPYFEQVAGISINRFGPMPFPHILIGVAVLLVTAVVSGAIPTLIYLRRNPMVALRAGSGSVQRRSWLAPGLIVFQFIIVAGLTCAAFVTRQQVDFMHTKDMGFDRENIVVLPFAESGIDAPYDALKRAMAACPGVLSVTGAAKEPGGTDINGLSYRTGRTSGRISLATLWVDPDYIRTLHIDILQGRDFDAAALTDRGKSFIVNRAALAELGVSSLDDLYLQGYPGDNAGGEPWYAGPVVGLTDDFHFRYLKTTVQPLVMVVDERRCRYMMLRIVGDDMPAALAAVKKAWQKLDSRAPFEYSFLGDDIAALYAAEDNQVMVVSAAGGLAVLAACLGLLGLAALNLQRRVKEIGIRKVMGASVGRIVTMLLFEFLKLVALACVIAWPIAYFFLHRWLENFVYRVGLSPLPFVLSGLAVLMVTTLTVIVQVSRAARANPVESIRYE